MDMDKKDSQPERAATHILVKPDARGLDHGKPYFHLLYAKELDLDLEPSGKVGTITIRLKPLYLVLVIVDPVEITLPLHPFYHPTPIASSSNFHLLSNQQAFSSQYSLLTLVASFLLSINSGPFCLLVQRPEPICTFLYALWKGT